MRAPSRQCIKCEPKAGDCSRSASWRLVSSLGFFGPQKQQPTLLLSATNLGGAPENPVLSLMNSVPKIKPTKLCQQLESSLSQRAPRLAVDLSGYLQAIIFMKTVGCAWREMFSTIGEKTMRKLWNKEHSDSYPPFRVKA